MMVRRYRDRDLEQLEPRIDDDWGASPEAIAFMVTQCQAWTYLIDDHPVMIIGTWKLWKGNWECWAMPSDEARGHALKIVRHTRRILDELSRDDDIHRFTALSREDKTEYNRWLRMIGFTEEYRQKKAFDGRLDVIGFVRHAWANHL